MANARFLHFQTIEVIAMKALSYSILNELRETIEAVDENALFQLADEILDAKHVFVGGCGRSEQTAKMFAMRLMHLSIPVFVVRDVTTPAIKKGDTLVLFSNVPESKYLGDLAKKAYHVSASLCVFTYQKSSPMVDLATVAVQIPQRGMTDGIVRQQTAGVLFDQCSMLLADTLIAHLANKLNIATEILLSNRSNLE